MSSLISSTEFPYVAATPDDSMRVEAFIGSITVPESHRTGAGAIELSYVRLPARTRARQARPPWGIEQLVVSGLGHDNLLLVPDLAATVRRYMAGGEIDVDSLSVPFRFGSGAATGVGVTAR